MNQADMAEKRETGISARDMADSETEGVEIVGIAAVAGNGDSATEAETETAGADEVSAEGTGKILTEAKVMITETATEETGLR